MRKLPPLKSLYTFVAVAETGSMTEAAKELNVSHSAVSQAIKALETQLGQPLLKRVGRQVTLNSVGRKYYRKVAPALETIVHATQGLMVSPHSQRITLNMVNSLAMHWWIPRMQNFNQYAPKVDVRISTLIGHFSLEEEGVDVAIIHGKTDEWLDYYCEKLAIDELVMVCHPDLLRDGISPTELLAQYPAIAAANDRRKHDWQVWCHHNGLAVPDISKNLSFSASVQAVQACIRKLGVFVTHRLFIKDDVEQGLLVEIGDAALNPFQDFYFACRIDSLKSENVLLLRNWLRAEFDGLN
ncbi:LysR substrate-binding domain-containing protein [Vibrio panuliri]|uniref:LysR family transcriptional regulator n=1 Tax=Vibrio panuliri TaxID=1381081 RepID=A0ABX3F6F3_9VIBR|nr:LysR substrate-binding domain-containing protein [Vibrio panuliri]KAB1457785.1 LysR family transcriptional regulator [Vibrio panuliri]OLQ85732.1 LysR family transcriptional regulator [Vibrio panuliri]